MQDRFPVENQDIIVFAILLLLLAVAFFLVKFLLKPKRTKQLERGSSKFIVAFSGKVYNLASISSLTALLDNIALSVETYRLLLRIFSKEIKKDKTDPQTLYFLFKDCSSILELQAKLKGILLRRKVVIDSYSRYLDSDKQLDLLRMDRYKEFHFQMSSLNNASNSVLAEIAFLQACEYYSRFKFTFALRSLDKAIKLDPNNPKFYNFIYKVYFKFCGKVYKQTYLTTAVSLAREHRDNLQLAIAIKNMAHSHLANRKQKRAYELCQKALDILVNVEDEKNYYVVCDYFLALGRMLYDIGNYEMAKDALDRALSIDAKKSTKDVLKTIDISHLIAKTWYRLGSCRKAQKYCERAFGLEKRFLGSSSRRLAYTLNLQAKIFEVQGKFTQAQNSCKKAESVIDFSLGDKSLFFVVNALTKASIYNKSGEFEKEASTSLTTANINRRAASEIGFYDYSLAFSFAKLFRSLKKRKRALGFAKEAQSFLQKTKSPKNRKMAEVYTIFGDIYRDSRENKLALDYYEKALLIHNKLPTSIQVANIYVKMADLSSNKREYSKAIAFLDRAFKVYSFITKEQSFLLSKICRKLAKNWEASGNILKAITFYNKTLDVVVKIFGTLNYFVIEDYENLARVWEKQSNKAKSEFYLKKAYELAHQLLGGDDPKTRGLYEQVERAESGQLM